MRHTVVQIYTVNIYCIYIYGTPPDLPFCGFYWCLQWIMHILNLYFRLQFWVMFWLTCGGCRICIYIYLSLSIYLNNRLALNIFIFHMIHLLKTDLDILYLLISFQQNHLCLKDNISNSSTPGFKAMKLQDHLHYTDFKNESSQQKKKILLKNARCWRKS